MKLDSEGLIKAYNEGKSLNIIAKEFHTYPTSVKRVLEREGVNLRHDAKKAGEFYVQDGEKLIEWAKLQGRLVTRTELAKAIGKKRLSPSYFERYPELNKYIKIYGRKELQDYQQKLYNWLQENNIPYKPNDKTKLGMIVSALLLEDYVNTILQIDIKPKYVSEQIYRERMLKRKSKAEEQGIKILFLPKVLFNDLDVLKDLL